MPIAGILLAMMQDNITDHINKQIVIATVNEVTIPYLLAKSYIHNSPNIIIILFKQSIQVTCDIF